MRLSQGYWIAAAIVALSVLAYLFGPFAPGSTPRGLLGVTLEWAAKSELHPHWTDPTGCSEFHPGRPERAVLHACPIAKWKQSDFSPANVDSEPYYYFECRTGNETIQASVWWADMGIDGVTFSRCPDGRCRGASIASCPFPK